MTWTSLVRPRRHVRLRRTTSVPSILALFLPGLLAPATAAAQSLQSGYGFGSVMDPLPARAVALGGVGVGLLGSGLSIQDPTAPADAVIPAVIFTSQSGWNDVDEGGTLSTHTSSRFPVVGVVYPVGNLGVASLSFAGVMDQNWATTQERLVILEGGNSTQARVTDRFQSEGGVSSLRLGFARRVSRSLSVGASVGRYIGNVNRRFLRTFDSLEVETSVPPFETGGNWEYSGTMAALGASLDFPGTARLSLSYTAGGQLDATPTQGTQGAALGLDMPGEFRVGGTVLLSSVLSLSGGVLAADWSGAGDNLQDVDGTSVLRLGGGMEWSGFRLIGKDAALRVGYRQGDEPFRRAGDPVVDESAWTAGLGINLLAAQETVLARTDLALERGTREGGVFSEEFWRLSVSVRVSGSVR